MGSRGVGHDWATSLSLFFHFHALEQEMATHSSVLAWRIPGMGEPGGLSSVGLHRVGHDWSDLAASKELSCINDLTASLLPFSLRGLPAPFLSKCVHLCLAPLLTEQTVSLCALPLVVMLSLIINFVPAFIVSVSVINAFFTEGKDPGINSF